MFSTAVASRPHAVAGRIIVGMTLYLSPDVVIRENIEVHNPGREMEVIHGTNDLKSTQTTIPFFKSNNLDYADLVSFMGEHAQTAGWILFVIVTIIVVTAVSNGANLNDGMDGMAYSAQQRWICANTYVEGRRLRFDGTGLGFFFQWLVIMLLTAVTFGIYAPWGYCQFKRWVQLN